MPTISESEAARIVILISGSGTNLQAFIDATRNKSLSANIVAVISNKPDIQGLARAEKAGIQHRVINHKNYTTREEFDHELAVAIEGFSPDLVVLAGFMRILSNSFVRRFEGMLMNIHPSLLPKYPGLNTHQRAIDAGDNEAGSTVHFVTAELDGGPAIIQARVPILTGDTADSLALRVLTEEHKIYPLAAQWFCRGRLRLSGEIVYLDDAPIPENGIQFDEQTMG